MNPAVESGQPTAQRRALARRDGASYLSAGWEWAGRAALPAGAIRLLKSGKILYTLNRAAAAAPGATLWEAVSPSRKGARPLTNFTVSRREHLRHHCLSRPRSPKCL